MYRDLLEKLPATFLDEDKITRFIKHMDSRVQKGKKEYPTTYTFDPIEAAMEECVDTAVYVMILYYRLERIREQLNAVGSKKS